MLGLLTRDEERVLTREIRELREAIADLRIRKDTVRQELGLSEEVVRLKKEITDLRIEKSRLTEEHAREDRELRHMIGLEKKRQEVELEQAKRGTELTVREENLKADKERFAEQMKFQNDRFTKEVEYLKGLMGEILARLPTVTVDRRVGK